MKWVVALSLLSACAFRVGATGSTTGDDAAVIDGPSADGSSEDVPPDSPKRRVRLTFANAGGIALDGFVALVVLTPARIDYVAATPASLRFTDADGTFLPFEIDEWNPGGTSLVWVRVPMIDPSAADHIYLHYGDASLTDAQDPARTWQGRSAVWHLAQDPGPGGTGDIKDATGAHHATASAAMVPADRVAGAIGHGLRFGAANTTDVTTAAFPVSTYTWTMWLRPDAAPVVGGSNHAPLSDGNETFNFAWDHSQQAFAGAAAQKDAGGWRSTGQLTWTGGTWYFLAGTYDGTNLCLYRNAASTQCTSAGAPLAPTQAFHIGGASSNNAATFAGVVDEVQVSAGAQSAMRLAAEYASERDAFITFGAPETE